MSKTSPNLQQPFTTSVDSHCPLALLVRILMAPQKTPNINQGASHRIYWCLPLHTCQLACGSGTYVLIPEVVWVLAGVNTLYCRELRSELASHGLKTSGVKSVLVKRLLEHNAKPTTKVPEPTNSPTPSSMGANASAANPGAPNHIGMQRLELIFGNSEL